MGIRSNTNTKNRLREDDHPVLTLAQPAPVVQQDPLRFRTAHPTKPCFVDLTHFATGRENATRGGKRKWLGAYQGRPELIRELAPALRDRLTPTAEKTISHFVGALTAWWRLFDEMEAKLGVQKITSVSQLTDLHRQFAMDKGLARKHFGNFLSLANLTRQAMGLKVLHWKLPWQTEPVRHLASQEIFLLVRKSLKRRWFIVLDRWALAEALLKKGAPVAREVPLADALAEQKRIEVNTEQKRLLKNYQHFNEVVAATGLPRPAAEFLYREMGSGVFSHRGYSVRDMLAGCYPSGDDVRAAFHLCLATTGWNPAVLLSLDVNEPFIEVHPMDGHRYVLRGTKARARGAAQVSEGLVKSQGSAGVILQTLMARNAPLREQLRGDLEACKLQRSAFVGPDLDPHVVRLDRRIMALEQAARSPWLYASTASGGELIASLTDRNFDSSVSAKDGSYLHVLVKEINQSLPADQHIPRIKSGDFRDAYAYDAYHASAGSILAVYKALGHRQVQTTVIYLHNTLLKEEHRKLFGTFSQALWNEMEATARVDPTVIAKWSRDGEVTPDQRKRLDTYRTLMLSRVGTGCKDPHHPPKHIAPNFVADGEAKCHVQRCTLCVEHAVIMPESLSGLCKRLAELRHLQSQMGIAAFTLLSRFDEELKNTEIALLAFDEQDVKEHVDAWQTRIENGEHRVVAFDGAAQGGNE